MSRLIRNTASPGRLLPLLVIGAACNDTGLNPVRKDPPPPDPTHLLQVEPAEVEVTGLATSESWTGTIVWTSVGEDNVLVEDVEVSGAGWMLDLTSVPVNLAPGASLVASLTFEGGDAGTWPGTVTLWAETDAGSSMRTTALAVVEGTTSVDTGAGPDDTATGTDTGEQVTQGCGGTLPSGLSVVDRRDVPGTAQLALDSSGRRLFVPYEYGDSAVGVYDADTLDRLRVLEAGAMPDPALVEEIGGHVLVGNKLSATVSVYDAETLETVSTLRIVDPQHFVFDADLGLIYVASMSAGEIIALDATSLEERGRIPLEPHLRQGAYAEGIAVFPSTSGLLHVIETASLAEVDAVDLGEQLFGSAWLPEADRIYVSGWDSSTVYVLEASTLGLVTTLPVGAPYQMAVDRERCLVAITGYGDDRIYIVDATTDSVVVDAEVCSAPMDVVFDPETGHWLVACYGSDEIAIVAEL